MSLKIIGAGFGRTGTLSMKFALEELGFSACYHMIEVRKNPGHPKLWSEAKNNRGTIDWSSLFTGYQASVDWPSCNFWREQASAFPDSKILLTLRDPSSWYESVMNTIYPSSKKFAESKDKKEREFGVWAMEMIWESVFDNNMKDRSFVIEKFERHNEQVIQEVPPERLLVFEAGDGWSNLCDFLEVPIPKTVFPKVNTTEQFLSQASGVSAKTKNLGDD